MDFIKMHGAGNDFIIINNMEEQIPVDKLGDLAEKLCHRRYSIGADGLMVIDYPEFGGDYKMRYYNADGTFGEMCGNGARCVARYAYEDGLADKMQNIETIAGMVKAYRETEDIYVVRLNDITVFKKVNVEVCGKSYDCIYAELGEPGIPHVVVEMKGLASKDKKELKELGRAMRNYKEFPKGANVNFYDMIENDCVEILTYERGVEDFTLACGTGAGSVVAVLANNKEVSGSHVKVKAPGGDLFVTVAEEGLFLAGPTEVVADGRIKIKELL